MSCLLSDLREDGAELTAESNYSGYWPMGEAMLSAADVIESLWGLVKTAYIEGLYDGVLTSGGDKLDEEEKQLEWGRSDSREKLNGIITNL